MIRTCYTPIDKNGAPVLPQHAFVTEAQALASGESYLKHQAPTAKWRGLKGPVKVVAVEVDPANENHVSDVYDCELDFKAVLS